MSLLAFALLAQRQSPFSPPSAFLHYAPDRTCDLQHIALDIDVDYPTKTYTGHIVNTMSPLREDIKAVRLMAGPFLKISKVTVNGQTANYKREGRNLYIDTPDAHKGKPMDIAIDYSASNTVAASFGGDGGFHWINKTARGPETRVGFWTQGEPESNSDWAPTWDYPNDLTTSETRCTVPADWTVIGNGLITGNKLTPDGKKRTFQWTMKIPHATYLLTLCGGPFDIKRDSWEGVQLWYVVPRGEGKYIDDTFGDTKDMLSFYSKILGYKYCWPKYAQDAMYDFGGGMENASATTLGSGEITEKREGFRTAASVNSHELGHQWFGDTVTCKDWGDTWLNESFATVMQFLYFEHSRGKNAYDREIDNAIRSYLAEAQRYKRPLSTKMYTTPISMFDSHTYPKGGVILHTLRKFLGDDNFFAGLNLYLHTNEHHPVESAQLRRAFIEATGINVEPFWAQWIEKPGHPVLDYTWKQEGGKTSITIKQTQDTSNGTPTYDIPAHVAVISGGQVTRLPVRIHEKEETIDLPVNGTADAIILDPDHDFLREIPTLHTNPKETMATFRYAPNGDDRSDAMRRLISDSPSAETIRIIADTVKADAGLFPSFRTLRPLGGLAKPELRSLWLSLLTHESFERRAEAVQALSQLPADAETTKRLRDLINDQSPISVVIGSIQALAKWDAKGSADVFKKAQGIESRGDRIKRAATEALGS